MSRYRLAALAAAGIIAGFAMAAFLTPRPAPQVQVSPTATPASGLAASLGQAAGGTGAAGERQVVMTEAQVNQQLTEQLQQTPGTVPFRNPQVRLRRDGRVDLRGMTQVAGRETEVQAIVKVDASQGTLNLEIESAQAGNLPVPSLVAQEIAERAAVSAGLTGLKGNPLPDGIEAVTVEEGRLIITRRQ